MSGATSAFAHSSGRDCVDVEVQVEVTPNHALGPGDAERVPVQVPGAGTHAYPPSSCATRSNITSAGTDVPWAVTAPLSSQWSPSQRRLLEAKVMSG